MAKFGMSNISKLFAKTDHYSESLQDDEPANGRADSDLFSRWRPADGGSKKEDIASPIASDLKARNDVASQAAALRAQFDKELQRDGDLTNGGKSRSKSEDAERKQRRNNEGTKAPKAQIQAQNPWGDAVGVSNAWGDATGGWPQASGQCASPQPPPASVSLAPSWPGSALVASVPPSPQPPPSVSVCSSAIWPAPALVASPKEPPASAESPSWPAASPQVLPLSPWVPTSDFSPVLPAAVPVIALLSVQPSVSSPSSAEGNTSSWPSSGVANRSPQRQQPLQQCSEEESKSNVSPAVSPAHSMAAAPQKESIGVASTLNSVSQSPIPHHRTSQASASATAKASDTASRSSHRFDEAILAALAALPSEALVDVLRRLVCLRPIEVEVAWCRCLAQMSTSPLQSSASGEPENVNTFPVAIEDSDTVCTSAEPLALVIHNELSCVESPPLVGAETIGSPTPPIATVRSVSAPSETAVPLSAMPSDSETAVHLSPYMPPGLADLIKSEPKPASKVGVVQEASVAVGTDVVSDAAKSPGAVRSPLTADAAAKQSSQDDVDPLENGTYDPSLGVAATQASTGAGCEQWPQISSPQPTAAVPGRDSGWPQSFAGGSSIPPAVGEAWPAAGITVMPSFAPEGWPAPLNAPVVGGHSGVGSTWP